MFLPHKVFPTVVPTIMDACRCSTRTVLSIVLKYSANQFSVAQQVCVIINILDEFVGDAGLIICM